MNAGLPTRDDKLTLLFYLFIRQMGDIADCLRHLQSPKQGVHYSEEEDNSWVEYIRTELADTLKLVQRTCTVLGIDYDSTVVMGTVRDTEKKKEYMKRHPEAHWV